MSEANLVKKYRTIPLSKGRQAIVDDCDAELVTKFKWACSETKTPGRYYAVRLWKERDRQRGIRMHQLIIGKLLGFPLPAGYEVDHIDGDGLDNRRSNLRIVTRTKNNLNARVRRQEGKTSRFKGVSFVKEVRVPWEACITIRGQRFRLGRFSTEELAKEAYDRANCLAQSELV